MFRKPSAKSEIDSNYGTPTPMPIPQPPPPPPSQLMSSRFDTINSNRSSSSNKRTNPSSNQQLSSKVSNVKSWVYNTDLKYAIGDLRNQLINEAKNTNPAMKQKIQDWVARDYEEAAAHIFTKETPVAKENEAMRQLISDLLNGPIASLLNKDGRNKLCRLSIPSLPANGIFISDDTYYDDREAVLLRPGPSYSGSFTSSVSSSHDNYEA